MDENPRSAKDLLGNSNGLSLSSSGEPQPRILNVLNDPQQRVLFQKYCKSKYCHENLAFYEEVELYESLTDEFVRPLRAQAIFEKYISPSAPLQVNIDEFVRNVVAESLDKGELTLFTKAKADVIRLMDEGTYMGFTNSPAYRDYLKRLANPGPMLPIAGSEEAQGEKIILVDSWVHTSSPAKNKLAKKLHKELQTIEETKQFAGNQTLIIQEENERLSIWCNQLEQDSLNNKKRIAQIEKRLASTRASNESMRQEITSLLENLSKSHDLLNSLHRILDKKIDLDLLENLANENTPHSPRSSTSPSPPSSSSSSTVPSSFPSSNPSSPLREKNSMAAVEED